mmetsp:Transcript_6471/g.14116  ORF Transcript_6471/g.14116 Transcript_6471/m.14116 type:complete len:218 (+) Transcript_6471:459-1112(+)
MRRKIIAMGNFKRLVVNRRPQLSTAKEKTVTTDTGVFKVAEEGMKMELIVMVPTMLAIAGGGRMVMIIWPRLMRTGFGAVAEEEILKVTESIIKMISGAIVYGTGKILGAVDDLGVTKMMENILLDLAVMGALIVRERATSAVPVIMAFIVRGGATSAVLAIMVTVGIVQVSKAGPIVAAIIATGGAPPGMDRMTEVTVMMISTILDGALHKMDTRV